MKLSLVVPVYNEEEVIVTFYERVNTFFANELSHISLEVLFVDDGSTDETLQLVSNICEKDKRFSYISFSRNFGKESALFAGLEHISGDVIVPLDVDLQNPLEVIPQMLDKINNGADVVLGKKILDTETGFLKRISANYFYKINNKLSSIKMEENVSDFRMMTKQVVAEIIKLNENQLFMKGLMSWVGFKTEIITYKISQRISGNTKFNFLNLWNLALNGITSFSVTPLKLWSYVGGGTALISLLYGLKIIIEKLFFGIEVSGYASLMVAVLFFGGVQLLSIGILGEYLGRTYLETKRRPKYIVKSKKLNFDNE